MRWPPRIRWLLNHWIHQRVCLANLQILSALQLTCAVDIVSNPLVVHLKRGIPVQPGFTIRTVFHSLKLLLLS
jgi:hypothetical protein